MLVSGFSTEVMLGTKYTDADSGNVCDDTLHRQDYTLGIYLTTQTESESSHICGDGIIPASYHDTLPKIVIRQPMLLSAHLSVAWL